MPVNRFLLRIRRRESPFYDTLYRLAKSARRFEMPQIPGLYKLLYYERATRLSLWRNFIRVAYQQPVFKARCDRVGRRLRVYYGIPVVLGHLKVIVGDDVSISGVTTFTGTKALDNPVLELKDHAAVGHQTQIFVGERVTIGRHAAVTQRCTLVGDEMHPLDPATRWTKPATPGKPMTIDDGAMIAMDSIIYKGLTVGKWSVVAPGSVVAKNVPPYTVVAGNPARVIWRVPHDTDE